MREKITLAEFHSRLDAQGVALEDKAFVCPACKTVQSARDLIKAGAGQTFEDVNAFLGFSCFGRFTSAGSARKEPDGKPCNWTLGGLFQIHELEVETEEGVAPMFVIATPEQAQAHAKEHE